MSIIKKDNEPKFNLNISKSAKEVLMKYESLYPEPMVQAVCKMKLQFMTYFENVKMSNLHFVYMIYMPNMEIISLRDIEFFPNLTNPTIVYGCNYICFGTLHTLPPRASDQEVVAARLSLHYVQSKERWEILHHLNLVAAEISSVQQTPLKISNTVVRRMFRFNPRSFTLQQ